MSHLTLSLLTTLAELYSLRAEWQELVNVAEGATVFQTWEWVTSWYEHFGHGKELLIFTVRNREGRLVALAPCSRSSSATGSFRLLHLLGRGNELTEYVQILARPQYEQVVTRLLFDAWHRMSNQWDLFVLPVVPGDGAFVAELRRQAEAQGYAVLGEEHVRMVRPLPESWERFYRSLRKSMKDNVNNYVNRLRRAGHREEMVVVEDPAELDQALDVFLDLHRRRAAARLGRQHNDYFSTRPNQEFLRTVARRLPRGTVWPCLLKVDGQIVASQICLSHKGRLYLYYTGYDPAWARHGVMMILTRRCIERAIERGCRELDLLLGLDQDKLRWGAEPRPVFNLALASRRLRSRVAFHLYRFRQARLQRAATARIAASRQADPTESNPARHSFLTSAATLGLRGTRA
jgi:CelD/BcsL family acetyltransferase involved in cellulose biosynthesis